MLAPDAAWITDSGGRVQAIRRPAVGARKVAAVVAGFFRVAPQRFPDIRFETSTYNNTPGVVVYTGDEIKGLFLVEVIDGRITTFYLMVNPDKLTGVTVARTILRE